MFFSNFLSTLFHLLANFHRLALRLVSLNKLIATLNKNISNSGEVVFESFQIDFLRGG